MTEIRVVYDDFSKGEFGHRGAQHAPEGSYTGRNVHTYRNGLIGPRPGLKAVSPTVTPGGTIKAIWWSQGAPNIDLFWILTTGAVEKCRLSTGVVTSCGSLGGAPTVIPQAAYVGLGVFIVTSKAQGTYIVDVAAGTTTAITSLAGGTDVAVVGERIFVANNGTSYFRVWYSDAAVFTSAAWPADNFFDVGHTAGIAALIGQRDHLAILLQDGSWYVYRGVGTSASLRKTSPGDWRPWVVNPNAVERMADDRIVYFGPLGDWPLTFDGATVDEHESAGPSGDVLPYSTEADVKVLVGRRAGEAIALFPSSDLIYSCRDGAWSLFSSSTAWTSVAASDNTALHLLTNGTTLWTLDMRTDRPAFTSDTYARPGDLSDTAMDAYFTLPEWWSKPGSEVRVMQVIVDFVKYTTGVTTNGFTVGVSAFGMFGNDGVEAAATQSFSEAGSAATTTGVRDRFVAHVGDQGFGAGFQIALTALVGVAIKSITVIAESQPSLPR